MHWFLIGFLLNTPITDHFDTREACEGRAVVLREKGADVKCIEFGPTVSGTVPPGIYFTPNSYIAPQAYGTTWNNGVILDSDHFTIH
jgi:hypothetical protein